MASNINPNNIDGAYPIAGQDNSSQGFRDNFTNIKNNLTVTKNEITDLQTKVILKSALTGITLDNDMEGTTISNLTALGMRDTINTLATGSGAISIDFDEGHTHLLTTSGSVTLSFANFPTTEHASVTIYADVTNVAHTIILSGVDSTNYDWLGHINTATDTVTFPAVGEYQIKISSYDGTTFFIDSIDVTPNYLANPVRTTTAQVSDTDTITTADAPAVWFETGGGGETCTLNDGLEGEIRTFAIDTVGSNMVMTVTNHGWDTGSTLGTITFSALGQGCTLQFINGKWFCVGNNGCTFA